MIQLTSGKNEVSFSGDWSPDGSQIVFVHFAFGDDHLEIQVMDADGSNPETVAECDPKLFCDSQAGAPMTGHSRRPRSPGRGRPSGPRRRGLGPTVPAACVGRFDASYEVVVEQRRVER